MTINTYEHANSYGKLKELGKDYADLIIADPPYDFDNMTFELDDKYSPVI